MRKIKILILSALAGMTILFLIACDFPSWQKLDISKIVKANAASLIYDRDGIEIGAVGETLNAKYVQTEKIPAHVKEAFIACEDKRFYKHAGIDIRRMAAAIINNIKSASYREGGSTITQQLVKLTHLTQEKKISRKANEVYLALQLERELSKDDILTAYLNTVYFGSGAYGIENAARIYFGKNAEDLSISEAATLAGIIKAPSAYSPDEDPEKAQERRNYVLLRMLEDGYISEEEMKKAMSESITVIDENNFDEFGWYKDLVLKEAGETLGITADQILTGGYRIYTCFDRERQMRIDRIFEDETFFPMNAENGTNAQSAFVALDSADGGILCVAGGRKYEVRRGFNRATEAKRQPGSALKPLCVYAAAVDGLGMLPTSIVDDTRRVFEGGYAPRNAGGTYNGLVTLREALSRSLNVAAVSLIEFTGIEKAREYALRFGLPISENDNGLALALGSLTSGVSPAQLAGGYAALSNGGYAVKPHAIQKIIDRGGRTVYEFTPVTKRVITSQSAYILTNMLETAADTGSARALRNAPCPVAAKTGTVSVDSSRNRDAWTAAYTTDISACIWMGFDETDNQMALKSEESGSFSAKLMASFMQDEAGTAFEMPSSIVELSIDKTALTNQNRVWLAPLNAPKALTQTEIFLKGREPSVHSPAFQTPPRPQAPMVFESGDEIVIRFVTDSDSNEYLVFEEIDGQKELIYSVKGETGQEKEVRVIRKSEHAVYTLAVRNGIMHEAGITLISLESEGVCVEGRRNITDMIEKLISGE